MRLTEALRLRDREVIAFVGGGGKTTAMLRLAAEIAAGGGRVVTTTTTRIFAAQTRLAPVHLAVSESSDLPPALESALAAHRHVLLTGPVDPVAGKAVGVQPSLVAQLVARADLAAVLIEADGSRMRPLKAPAEHEPVIPEATTLVVPVAGADVLGKPLDEAHTHRPELISRLASVGQGQAITATVVADLIAHPQGGRKNVPAGARFVPLINKVAGPARLSGAREIAGRLLRVVEVESVIVGAVVEADPVAEVWSRAAAVVLAAGEARRMGQLKQTMPWGGTTLVGHAVDVALASQAGEVILVVGCQAKRVAQAVAGRPVRVVVNPAWSEGQSASVRAGLEAVPPGFNAVIFLLADQPQITAQVIDAVIERHRKTLAPIVAPRAGGRRANPVLFDCAVWPQLARVTGDAGGRGLFEMYDGRVAWLDWSEEVLSDMDTPGDYASFVESNGRVSIGRQNLAEDSEWIGG